MTIDQIFKKAFNEITPDYNNSKNSWNINDDSMKEYFMDFARYIGNNIKTVVHGGFIGTTIGGLGAAIYASATGEDPLPLIKEYAQLGLQAGVIIDFHVYNLRFWPAKIKTDAKRIITATKNLLQTYKDYNTLEELAHTERTKNGYTK